MNKGFSLKTLIISIITGIIVVLLLSIAAGSRFDNSLFPVLSMLSGFIITGFLTGILSKGVTILEPGLGSIIVACITFFTIPAMHESGFAEISQDSDWLILLMNSIILTFVGAWLGEKFQNSGKLREDASSLVNWGWIVAGTIFGVVLSIIIGIIVNFIFGSEPIYFIIPFFAALFVSGLLVGLKSEGITIKEAGIAGFLIITVIFSIVRLTLVTEIEIEYLTGGIILGFLTAFIGGWAGEKIQAPRK